MKPHKGKIKAIDQVDVPGSHLKGQKHLGYVYTCEFIDHPRFAGERGHTSPVVFDGCVFPRHKGDSYEIETLNSRYTVVPS
jgi:hypothetical protein